MKCDFIDVGIENGGWGSGRPQNAGLALVALAH
jgi:hypothetical protein